ncbi:DUF262 domain-containing protein [Bacillus altitudinis MN12]|uniref:DUF262 domain-containing protein n=1 Tax=Bacillus TaxID=1386 RepID=UPI0011A6F480|nr:MULTISPECIES: DUF262 domain-containing protein [Bacillus]MBR0584967.1 DUF262 domain-containing protein [Bacillus altitudinis MN12]MBR0595931.1 DUF262 domain-containing protein [Bacillus altitudinis C16B11]MBR0610657.1 DUF262 domain-containing protein [Bacillus altitudinis]MCP1150786.1 DUF262 domain-containing protein [Bacillus sp. 1735sda2]
MDLNEKFEIKSESLGELFVKMRNKTLVYDPYYQRNFVWDTEHQKEFIRTILLGLPCPMIFVAEGEIDLETHIKYLHIIDGQQRMRTVEKFLSNNLEVDNKLYKDLEEREKINFSKYQIGTVRLKYNPEQDITEISKIFQRLNIGNYELTSTEKTLSKFSDNEFVFLARLISNDKILASEDVEGLSDDLDEDEIANENSIHFRENPFIIRDFKDWAEKKEFTKFKTFFLNEEIYSIQQIKRNVNTKDVIDLIGILINKEFHGRVLEDEEIEILTDTVLKQKNLIYIKFVKAIDVFNNIEIPEVSGFRKKKYFYLRSNAFSLFLTLLLNYEYLDHLDIDKFNEKLETFCSDLPDDYISAAKNSTMDKKQRKLRNEYLDSIIKNCIL